MLLLCLLALVLGWPGTASARKRRCDDPSGHSLVLFAASSDKVVRSYPNVAEAGVVLADGEGGYFGEIAVGCGATPTLRHIHRDGSFDNTWRPSFDGMPRAVVGSTLYVSSGHRVAALDARSGRERWRSAYFGGQGGIYDVAAGPRRIYVVGDFPPSLVVLDARSGDRVEWPPPKIGPYAYIGAVEIAAGRLFIGGPFRGSGFLALDLRSGRITSWRPGTAPGYRKGFGVGDVETILASHGLLFTGGHDGFGIIDARTGALDRLMAPLAGVGYTFAAHGRRVYVAGNCRNTFTGVAGNRRNNLAAVDVVAHRWTDWGPLLTKFQCIGSLAASGTRYSSPGAREVARLTASAADNRTHWCVFWFRTGPLRYPLYVAAHFGTLNCMVGGYEPVMLCHPRLHTAIIGRGSVQMIAPLPIRSISVVAGRSSEFRCASNSK
jgi:hypothetical protein